MCYVNGWWGSHDELREIDAGPLLMGLPQHTYNIHPKKTKAKHSRKQFHKTDKHSILYINIPTHIVNQVPKSLL